MSLSVAPPQRRVISIPKGATMKLYFAAAMILFPLIYRQLQNIIHQLSAQIIAAISETPEIALDTYRRNLALLNILPGVVYLLLATGFAILIRHTKYHIPEQFELKCPPQTLFMTYLCGITLFVTTVFALMFIPQTQTAQYEYADHMAILNQSPWLLRFIFTVIMAPIVEEVAFRAGMFANAKKIMPFWAALVLQALAFGFIHLDFSRDYWNYQQGLYALAVGLILGVIYHRTHSLTAVTIVHMSFNASNYYITPILIAMLTNQGLRSGMMIVMLLLLASIALSWLLISRMRRVEHNPAVTH